MDPEPPKLPAVGEVVGGKYRVERVIGRGGMGTVLAVRHLGLDEPRALKLMLPRGLELPQARERFFREARAAAKLRSEHAVAVHDVGVFPDGFPYIEMELLEGTDLGALLKRVHGVPVANAVEWIAQACEPVGEAHALGIVHRDIKPGNLFLARTQGGREIIKVLDFGIAKTASVDTDASLTGTNASFGSPMYMSPEQMRGARFADPRSDLWALGVVLFELMTGKRPFVSESVTALALIVTQEPAPHPRSIRGDVPPAIDAIVMRCLEKAPERRFASAAELAAALRSALGAALGEPTLAPRTSLPSLPHPSSGGGPLGRGPSLPGVAAPMLLAAPPAPSQPSGQVPSNPSHSFRVGVESAGPAISTPPSHPSVGTLSTTIGGSRRPSPLLLVGGAVAAAAMGVGIALVGWRAVDGGGASPAASGAPSVASPGAAAPPSAPAPTPAATVDTPPPGPTVEPPASPSAPAAPSASPSASATAPAASAASKPTTKTEGRSRPAPRPTTGFGGID